MSMLRGIFLLARATLQSRVDLAGEDLALGRQLAVLQDTLKRPRLWQGARIFWALPSPWVQRE